MSTAKQTRQQQHTFYEQQKTDDLTEQERKALSLAWSRSASQKQSSVRHDSDVAHCAVLGYN